MNSIKRSKRKIKLGRQKEKSTPYKAIALQDFDGYHNHNLPFQKDEVLTVISTSPTGWFTGLNSRNQVGSFPYKLVQSVHVPEKNIRKNYKTKRDKEKKKKEKEKTKEDPKLAESSAELGRNLFGSGYLRSSSRDFSLSSLRLFQKDNPVEYVAPEEKRRSESLKNRFKKSMRNTLQKITMKRKNKDEKCAVCSEPCGEDDLEFLGKSYHSECYKCCRCGHQMEDGEKSMSIREVLCETCFKLSLFDDTIEPY